MGVRKKFIKFKDNLILLGRWLWVRQKQSIRSITSGSSLDLCDIYYINLDHRTDRRANIEKQFSKLDLNSTRRMEAIFNENGALGCAQSHLKVLSNWKRVPERLLFVCEDDCEFSVDRREVEVLVEEFLVNPYLDVLCLAYNAKNGINISNNLMITSNTQTLCCYVLKAHMVEPMLSAAMESIDRLANGYPKKVAAIDVVWKRLQKNYMFALPIKRIAKQSASFSDIEHTDVDYGV
jgi:glycosyl transferase family 25